MGHVRNYTLGDVVARFRRMRGDKVMHPLGWDTFGLPAENAAIKNASIRPSGPGPHRGHEVPDPQDGHHLRLGPGDRHLHPRYYRWNQWLFLQMWERGDVFRALRNVNWCEALGTVLANEQVVDGKDERRGTRGAEAQDQCFFTSPYADELIERPGPDRWPENVKSMQRHWVGRCEGASSGSTSPTARRCQVFTTRLDTLFGVTFMVLSTEHPFIVKAAESDPGLRAFCDEVAHMSREDRLMSRHQAGPQVEAGGGASLHRREGSRLCGQLRAHGLRHRRGHGCARPRRAGLRLRQEVRPGDPHRHRAGGRPGPEGRRVLRRLR